MLAKQPSEMPQNGADLLVQSLADQGVELLFGYPGGAVLPEFDALYKAKFNNILVRHEQGAVHAAEGYAKSTGKTGVVIVTSGPGATNAITGIADAMSDSVPMVVFTGQVGMSVIGTNAFQEADVLSMTAPVTKNNYQVRSAADVPKIVAAAFQVAQSGRKGPVVVDLPKNVMNETATTEIIAQRPEPLSMIKAKEKREAMGKLTDMLMALDKAKKPLLLAGGGVIAAKAGDEFKKFARKHQIPVISTLLGIGAIPSQDPLFMGMAGMHGTYTANMAIHECDLLINIGCRFEDRLATNPKRFAPNAQIAHIDIDASEIGKIIKTDFGIIGDAKAALKEMLLAEPTATKHADWLTLNQERRAKHPYHYRTQPGALKPQQIIEEVGRLTAGKAIVTTDVGQHQMWAAQFYPFTFPGQLITSGGLGTMGFGLPASVGARFANPDRPVVLFTGDGSLQMTSEEMDVIHGYDLNIKIILLNNHTLGMVRQWQDLFYDKRRSQTIFHEQPNFQKLADAYGIQYCALDPEQNWQAALKQAITSEHAAFIEAPIPQLEAVSPMIAPGQPNENMLGVD
jgi:acetolactate synthase large subunit